MTKPKTKEFRQVPLLISAFSGFSGAWRLAFGASGATPAVNNRGANGWAQVIHAARRKPPAPAREQDGRNKPVTLRRDGRIYSSVP
jgi:hypothetical protein